MLAIKRIPIFILISVCLLGIGYAAMNSISFDLLGELGLTSIKGLFITDVVDDQDIQINGFYNGTILNSTVTLPESITASKTYEITVYNNTNSTYAYSSTICDTTLPEFYSNPDIIYTISGLVQDQEIAPHTSITFEITFEYAEEVQEIGDNVLNSCIEFNFKNSTISFNTEGTGGGVAFNLGEEMVDLSNQTFFVELDVSSILDTAINENIISIGQYISGWEIPSSKPGAVTLHIFYPSDDDKIVLSPLMQGQRHIQFKKIYSGSKYGGIMKIAFNSNGLCINGKSVLTPSGIGTETSVYGKQNTLSVEEYLELFFSKWSVGEMPVEIGSIQGDNRSYCVYNAIELYKSGMSLEEMIELTAISTGKPLEQVEYADYISTPYSPTGSLFDFGDIGFSTISLQTLYMEMDLGNMSATTTKENIFSIGTEIAEWSPRAVNGVNLHVYYPNTDGTVIFAVTLNGGGFKQWKVSPSDLNITDDTIKLAFNQRGLYINGVEVMSPDGVNPILNPFSNSTAYSASQFIEETFRRFSSGEHDIYVGSREGSNRSTITYDSLKVYEDLLSLDNLITLTEGNGT